MENIFLKAGELGVLGAVTFYVLTRMTTALDKLSESNKSLAESVKALADKINFIDHRVSYFETRVESRLDKLDNDVVELKHRAERSDSL
ncbi:MAG: hypothetical protein II968_02755 [Selenomonadaceae bacterium]|nr:hypothetical protein [Selenomonadaceae bacterium]MBQ4494665.1 hypothetical protein [Selenomonadaceae bacterium]MBR0102441.1 hypothetical protein [Selenomonadaceae bacterium]